METHRVIAVSGTPWTSYPIDQAFDTELGNTLARLESYNKHHYRPNSYLHKWWARRCGTTFRLLLKHLVDDPSRRDFYVAGGLEGRVILDPMMGGGTTLHEAIRLGANVIGTDIDPIPVLQARAALSKISVRQLEEAFEGLLASMRDHMEPFWQTACEECQRVAPMRFMLYGLNCHCQCQKVTLVDSLTLRTETDGSSIVLCPDCWAVIRNGAECGCPQEAPLSPLREKTAGTCSKCLSKYVEDTVTLYYARYSPVAAVGYCSDHGTFYQSPSSRDLAVLEGANRLRQSLDFGGSIPVNKGPKSNDLLRRGIRSYLDLFSSRQLLFLRRAVDLLEKCDPEPRLYLALLISTSLEFNSMLCGYKGAGLRRPGAIRHTFSHHAYSFPYTALENNPIFPKSASGTLIKLFGDKVTRARRWAAQPTERVVVDGQTRTVTVAGEQAFGEEVQNPDELREGTHRFLIRQESATSLDLKEGSVDFIVTDPPYFDNVQYGDLSTFFRVWLRRLLGQSNQEGIAWNYDQDLAAVSSSKGADTQYLDVMTDVFSECRRVLNKDRGRLIFTFHHRSARGWTALALSLKRAGFVLLNRYVVHSENPSSVHIVNLKSLLHDAVLVLAPIDAGIQPLWKRPTSIDRSDSAEFCRDCATLLGWILTADVSAAEIRGTWTRAFQNASAG